MSEYAGAWFADPKFLKRLGRGALVHFFAAFGADANGGSMTLPDPALPDDRYFQEAARFLEARRRRQWLSPNGLPISLRIPGLTLEPLRELGPDALNARDVPGIVSVTLCEIRIICNNGHCQSHTSEADDLFRVSSHSPFRHSPIPRAGRLTRATVRIRFADSTAQRVVVLIPPQTLQLVQASDAQPVKRWLERRGFIVDTGLDNQCK